MTADPPAKQRCLALTSRGAPCRAWAIRGSRARYGRPLCRVHQPDTAGDPVPWHLYAPYFTAAETAALRHLLDTLAALGDLSTAEIARLTPLVLATAGTIARLLKDQQVLRAGRPDPTQEAIFGALDIVSEEWGVEL